jgi:hypothetical protein
MWIAPHLLDETQLIKQRAIKQRAIKQRGASVQCIPDLEGVPICRAASPARSKADQPPSSASRSVCPLLGTSGQMLIALRQVEHQAF